MKLPASGALARNVTVAGQSIKMIQHFMDTPVAQPRRKGGPKADLTGLKVWPVSLRLVEYMHAELLSGVQQRAGFQVPHGQGVQRHRHLHQYHQ